MSDGDFIQYLSVLSHLTSSILLIGSVYVEPHDDEDSDEEMMDVEHAGVTDDVKGIINKSLVMINDGKWVLR